MVLRRAVCRCPPRPALSLDRYLYVGKHSYLYGVCVGKHSYLYGGNDMLRKRRRCIFVRYRGGGAEGRFIHSKEEEGEEEEEEGLFKANAVN